MTQSVKLLLLLLLLLAAALALLLGLRAARAGRAAPVPEAAAEEAEAGEETLPRAGSVEEAFALFGEALRRGETSFLFLAEGDWSVEELNALASELLANSAEIAAETGLYHYERAPSPDGTGERVCIEAEYRLDPELLQDRNLELRATLDELAAELKAQGGDERELYLAAARAVAERAAYDAETAAVPDLEALSDEQLCLRSAYGALVEGRTVCTGYAMAYKALCDRLDLPCRVVSGSRDGGWHAWNAISLDGETLYMDLTYADALGSEDEYFLSEAALAEKGVVPSLYFPGKTV